MKDTPHLDDALELLGGLTPQNFMRRHWQKKPLLVRQAVPDAAAILNRGELFSLLEKEGVESRLIRQSSGAWDMRKGPFGRRQLPALSQPDWTVLVQGVDLHAAKAHQLLRRFRFIPDARLDDIMVSFATEGGGVGPHFDSYDVFLLQLHGRRRWRVGRLKDPALQPGVPLKILSNFTAEQEWVLEPGDMLYLPPRWAHDGQAVGECMTCSVGFRAASRGEFAREVMQRTLDAMEAEAAQAEEQTGDIPAGPGPSLYRDPAQAATASPARIPEAMQEFAQDAVSRLLEDQSSMHCSLGEWLSEPKPGVWFDEPGDVPETPCALRLDDRSRMLYDDRHLFINGESFRASGRDARLLRGLADARCLARADVAKLSGEAWALVQEWMDAGWLRPVPGAGGDDGATR